MQSIKPHLISPLLRLEHVLQRFLEDKVPFFNGKSSRTKYLDAIRNQLEELGDLRARLEEAIRFCDTHTGSVSHVTSCSFPSRLMVPIQLTFNMNVAQGHMTQDSRAIALILMVCQSALCITKSLS